MIVDGQKYALDRESKTPVLIPKKRSDQGLKYNKDVNICSLNIRGLRKYKNDREFISFCRNYDIICLCETWQCNEDDFSNMIPGYIHFDSPRRNLRGHRGAGGVSVFIKDELFNSGIIKRIYNQYEECVLLIIEQRVTDLQNPIVLGFTYVAPENSLIYYQVEPDVIEILNHKLTSVESDTGKYSGE